uniref:Carboxylic ester hydrolase n=1 Tax=Steinernema glaseri TaxID=37863 RepID=A0A1I7ZX14_9BILA
MAPSVKRPAASPQGRLPRFHQKELEFCQPLYFVAERRIKRRATSRGRAMLLSAFYFAFLCVWVCSQDVEVSTKFGRLRGFQHEVKNGSSTNCFLGIPYAENPLRFERAKIVSPWEGIKNATSFGDSCYATMPWLMDAELTFSEDCLFLNVIAPRLPSRDPAGYPVIVWVQGGGFELGTSTVYGYEKISENFVSRDVVFVTFNYRLGPFGFLSTGDEVLPGNAGLWDQILALQFVKEVIADFGGNPKNVTIFGESAGAAAVSALTLSPHSNGLFHKAITISGSSFANFAINERVVKESQHLAQFLECEGSSQEILECLRNRSIDEFYVALVHIGPAKDRILGFRYSPRFDSDFFPVDSYTSLLATAPPIPTLAMITSAEMGIFTMNHLDMNLIDVEWIRREDYNEDDLRKIIKALAGSDSTLEEELTYYYVKREDGGERNATFFLTRLTQL